MTDVPGEGFEAGSAYVSVSPEGDDFQEEVRAIVGETDIVVQVPVVPDAEDFRSQLAAQVDAGDTAVAVPVVPDTAGFKLLLQDELAGSGAQPVTVPVVPDAAGFAGKVDAEVAGADKPVEIPVTPDMAGFAEKADADATAAGESAGATFSEAFAAVAARAQLFGASDAELDAAAGASGEAAGTSWRERFTVAANSDPDLEGLGAAADATMAAAGEAAGLSFSERFAAVVSRAQAVNASAASFAGIGAADGEAAGESFIGRMKGVIAGGMGSIEFLLGAGFVAASAVMANSFQEAMERIHTQAGVGQASIAGLSSQVLDLAGKVGESPDSLAASLYHVESAFQSNGITASAALHDVQIAAEGARVGGADLVDTTNALTALMKSGLVGGANSAAQAMGALNAIVGSGDMTMQDFTEALGSGLVAQAPLYHQSITQVGAALAVLGDSNIRGAKAATDLRMAWQAIQAPLKTGAAALQHLGLTSSELADTMVHHGLSAAIDQFVGRLKASHVPIGEWGQYVTEIFGKRAGAGIGVLTSQYENLNLKLGTVTHGVHGFGSAWQATQHTTSQVVHNLESGLEALMIRLGQGLLPILDQIFSAITKALPKIEKWGSAFAKIASPAVRDFFSGLRTTFHLLTGPLKNLTTALIGGGGLLFAFNLLSAAVSKSPLTLWVIGISAAITIIGKLHGPFKDAAIAVTGLAIAWKLLDIAMDLNPFSLILIAIGALVVLIVKYHKQIFDVIKKTWHDIESFFDSIGPKIFGPVERVFNDIKKFITGSFDGWWKSHGKELEEVWDAIWGTISSQFKGAWDTITGIVSAAWQLIGPFLEAGLSELEGAWKIAWDAISTYFQVVWDLIAAIVKIAIAEVELVIKTAWDIIVGIFDIALDLLTGHWSKAWDDMKTLVTQIWNNIKGFLSTVWNAISTVAVQIWHHIENFLSTSWDTIKSTASRVFGDIRTAIANIWHGIVSDIEGFVNHIKNIISGLGGDITGLPGKLLGGLGIHLARGGVVPGYAPGRDVVPALLSPGEGVLTPEAVRGLGGPGFVHSANATFSGTRAMASGGIVTSFAGGGIAGWDAGGGYSQASIGDLLQQLVNALTGQGQQFGARPGGTQSVNVEQNFYASMLPTQEQRQAMLIDLTSAISNA